MPDSPSFGLTTNASWLPVFTSKDDTDRCYDAAIAELLRAVANADGQGRMHPGLPCQAGH